MARRSDHTREDLKSITLEIAKKIVENEGFSKLTARRIAKEIGYAPGTIYNIFGSMDGLYFSLSEQTLDSLLQKLSDSSLYSQEAGTAENLKIMAKEYMGFAKNNKQLWLMIFNHTLPQGEDAPEWYSDKVKNLFIPLEKLLDPIFDKDQSREKTTAARVLWSSVHGICFMDETDKMTLISNESSLDLAYYLIDNFISGIQNK